MFPLGVMLMLHDYHSAVLNTKHNNKSVLKTRMERRQRHSVSNMSRWSQSHDMIRS